MEKEKLEIIYKNIDELRPYNNNPRKNLDAVKLVAESIREFGWQQPIVIDENDVIVVGHTRLMAAEDLGHEKVPCVVADNLTPEQIKAYRLADNKVGEVATWNEDLLDFELKQLDKDFMAQFGFEFENDDLFEKEKSKEKRIKAMELRAFEHYDYLVFVFKNQQDWLNAVNEFDIRKVDAGYGATKKVGVGRVVDGKRLLEKI